MVNGTTFHLSLDYYDRSKYLLWKRSIAPVVSCFALKVAQAERFDGVERRIRAFSSCPTSKSCGLSSLSLSVPSSSGWQHFLTVEKMSDGLLENWETADTDLKSLYELANGVVRFNGNLSSKISLLRELWAEPRRSNWIRSLEKKQGWWKHFVHGNSTNTHTDEQKSLFCSRQKLYGRLRPYAISGIKPCELLMYDGVILKRQRCASITMPTVFSSCFISGCDIIDGAFKDILWFLVSRRVLQE